MTILNNPVFWRILNESGSINDSRGMQLINLNSNGASLYTFIKKHSYGEYIFDWSWADMYARHGVAYYPKLTSMLPYTPATVAHFSGPEAEWNKLLNQHDEILKEYSSAHFLFTTPLEQKFLMDNNYICRHSFQYHFFNKNYKSFEEFLSLLKPKKAKNIRLERHHPGLKIEQLTENSLQAHHADEMYDFYLMTIEQKKAIPYLTRSFFQLLFKNLAPNVLYVRASQEDQIIAGALFYYDNERMYGRYWGANKFIPNLHFELCYYSGIEFCILNKIKVFEAGAQGEHKIQRGFKPVLTTSAHKINHPGFARAINSYIEQEKKQVTILMEELNKLLPFRD